MADSTFVVTQFEMGTLDSSDGSEVASISDIRTEFITIDWGLKKIKIESNGQWWWDCYAYDGSGNYLTYTGGADGNVQDLPTQTEKIRIVLSGARETSDKSATVTIMPQPLWVVENNKLTHEYLPPDDLGDSIMVDPYPPFWWYDENNVLQNRFLADPIYQGAFCDCVNLRKVIIPPSVKYIGEYAFYNTALTTVTIARDCTFFPTSFPPRCTINYYVDT
jgi:hypothetical protein